MQHATSVAVTTEEEEDDDDSNDDKNNINSHINNINNNNTNNTARNVQVFLALLLGGFVAVPLSLHLSSSHAAHVVREANLKAVFVSPATRSRYAEIAAEVANGLLLLDCLEGPSSVLESWAAVHDTPLPQDAAPPASELDVELPSNGGTPLASHYHGTVSGPAFSAGTVHLSFRLTSDARAVPKLRRMVLSKIGRKCEQPDAKIEAWGRWQVEGRIEEVLDQSK